MLRLLLPLFLLLTGCTAIKKMAMVMGSNPQAENPSTVQLGAIVYKANCVQCHGETGEGGGELASTLSKAPANLKLLAEKKSAKSFAASTMYGKGKEMPAFEGKVSEAEVWHVANYVKSLGAKPGEKK